jgi:hypothetical protein
MDHGQCDKYKIYWYFNQLDKQCDRFYYGGCDGNQNRFESKEICEMSCKMSEEEKGAFLKLPKQCVQSIDYGSNCIASVQKWYFDTETKVCYPFEYTGCGPENANRFNNFEECNQLCIESLTKYLDLNITKEKSNENASSESSLKITNVNQLDTQSARGLHIFNIGLHINTFFLHIKSNFHVSKDNDVCDLQISVGNCSEKIMKWFYDSNLKYCRQFEFTGCISFNN